MFAFDHNLKRQIEKVIDYANSNIYNVDDVLDMKNQQMAPPGEDAEHSVLLPFGRWVCYYLVDHPEFGRTHYFSIKDSAYGRIPSTEDVKHIVREFGIDIPILDKHISIDERLSVLNIVLPAKPLQNFKL